MRNMPRPLCRRSNEALQDAIVGLLDVDWN